jgi:hypothetical protein
MPGIENIDLQFCKFEVPVDTLDNIFRTRVEIFSGFDVDGMKIDVEGLEFVVLKGAAETLNKHRPLVMAEGGNRSDGLQDFMTSMDYIFAERSGEKLIFINRIGTAANGYFVHRSKIEEYKMRGILQ